MRSPLWSTFTGALVFALMLIGCAQPSDSPETAEDEDTEDVYGDAEWGYSGDIGPENWADLSAAYAACAGSTQSPIDLTDATEASDGALELNYSSADARLVDTGHSVQANLTEGNAITLDGNAFNLLQLHFHAPSEHTIDGASFPSEVHFVHQSADGELAVIGVMLEEGEANPLLDGLWAQMPDEDDAQADAMTVQLADLLPDDRSYYRYDGSLTTPPCSPGVNWIVMRTPITMSTEQLEALRERHDGNARPVQPLNDRTLRLVSSGS